MANLDTPEADEKNSRTNGDFREIQVSERMENEGSKTYTRSKDNIKRIFHP